MENVILSDTFQTFLAKLAGDVLAVMLPVVLTILGGVLLNIYKWARSLINVEQEKQITSLVNMAVQAAQQTGLLDEVLKDGAAKKAYALQVLQDSLKARGLGKFAEYIPELSARIEAAINQQVHYPPVVAALPMLPPERLVPPGSLSNNMPLEIPIHD